MARKINSVKCLHNHKWLFALAIVLATAPTHTAMCATTQPADDPATRPAENVSAMAIELSEGEKTVLAVVRDGTADIDESAFWKMLNRADQLAASRDASKAELADLDSPSTANMLTAPAHYRAQKIRLTVRIYTCNKLVSGTRSSPARRDWPAGREYWYMTGSIVRSGGPQGAEETLMIYSAADPADLLGKPTSVGESGQRFAGVQLTIAAIFYKTRLAQPRVPEEAARDYPLVLAYYLEIDHKPTGAPWQLPAVIVGLMVVLIVVFARLRRKVKTMKRAQHPAIQRVADSFGQAETSDDEPAPDEAESDIDPDLVSAVRKWHEDQHDRPEE